MICSELLNTLVDQLAANENSTAVLSQAIAPIAEHFRIGELRVVLCVPNTAYTPGGTTQVNTAYSRGCSLKAEPSHTYEFYTGENGQVSFQVYMEEGKPDLSDEDSRDLNTVFSILFFHYGRFRLAQIAVRSANFDLMTGLPNATGYQQAIMDRIQAKRIHLFNAYYINLSNFGLVNQRFGRHETDRILVRYTRTLSKFLMEGEVLARFGGDNFGALIYKERTQQFLNLLAGTEISVVRDNMETTVLIRAAAGVCELDFSVRDFGPVISNCAVALNIAKNVQKKPYVFITDEINSQVYREKQVGERFLYALKKEQFLVFYQPKVDTDGYRLVGAEALVRWQWENELLPPSRFIPVLEQDDSICELDYYILDHVCRDLRYWMDHGMDPVRVSVNFSRKHLTNPNLADDILQIVDKYRLDHKYIEIEMTETTSANEYGMMHTFLADIRSESITVSIDDFGTGYSSLNILRDFPVDVLKIDKSFIDGASDHTANDRIVLSCIVKMAKDLHMEIVTEGVETWDQLRFLQTLNCHVIQGFLFDQPMPAYQFEQRLQNKVYDPASVHDFGT